MNISIELLRLRSKRDFIETTATVLQTIPYGTSESTICFVLHAKNQSRGNNVL